MSAVIDQPTYTLQVAFNTGVPSWTTLPNLRSFAIGRGRNDELGAVQAGTLTLVVGNPTGDLSPDNAGGAYYPNILPVNPIRLQATYNAITYTLFRGFVQSWVPVDNTVMDGDVRIGAVDWFNLANLGVLNTSFAAAADEGARISAALALVDTRNLPTAIETGEEPLLASTLVNVGLLQHVGDVLAGERGLFFCAADGTITFHNRQHRFFTSRCSTSQGTFDQSRAAGALNYVALDYLYDDRYIANDIQVTASGSDGLHQFGDATSKTRYGVRSLAVQAPWMIAGQGDALAQWLLQGYKDAHPRVAAITVDSDANPSGLLPHQLGREIADRITVIKQSPGVLGISRDFWIEGVRHQFDAASGRGLLTTWQLSDPAVYGPQPFRLDVDTLDGPRPLGY